MNCFFLSPSHMVKKLACLCALLLAFVCLPVSASLMSNGSTPANIAVYSSYAGPCSDDTFTGQQFAYPLNKCVLYENSFQYVIVQCNQTIGGVHVDVFADSACKNSTLHGAALTGDYPFNTCLTDAEYNYFQWVSCGTLPDLPAAKAGDVIYRAYNNETCAPSSLVAQNTIAADTCFPGFLLDFPGSFQYSCYQNGSLTQTNYTATGCTAASQSSPALSYPLNQCVQMVGQNPPVWMIVQSCLDKPITTTTTTTKPTTNITTSTPKPSTSTSIPVVTTRPPWQLASYNLSITFDFDCKVYSLNATTYNKLLIDYISITFTVDSLRLSIYAVTCGSTIFSFSIAAPSAATDAAAQDITTAIGTAVFSNHFNVPGLGVATNVIVNTITCANGRTVTMAQQCNNSVSAAKSLWSDINLIAIMTVVGAALLLF